MPIHHSTDTVTSHNFIINRRPDLNKCPIKLVVHFTRLSQSVRPAHQDYKPTESVICMMLKTLEIVTLNVHRVVLFPSEMKQQASLESSATIKVFHQE